MSKKEIPTLKYGGFFGFHVNLLGKQTLWPAILLRRTVLGVGGTSFALGRRRF